MAVAHTQTAVENGEWWVENGVPLVFGRLRVVRHGGAQLRDAERRQVRAGGQSGGGRIEIVIQPRSRGNDSSNEEPATP